MRKDEWIAYYQDRVSKARRQVCSTERAYRKARNINGICKILVPVGVFLVAGACITDGELPVDALAGMGVVSAVAGYFGFKFFETDEKVKKLKERAEQARANLNDLESQLDSYSSIL